MGRKPIKREPRPDNTRMEVDGRENHSTDLPDQQISPYLGKILIRFLKGLSFFVFYLRFVFSM